MSLSYKHIFFCIINRLLVLLCLLLCPAESKHDDGTTVKQNPATSEVDTSVQTNSGTPLQTNVDDTTVLTNPQPSTLLEEDYEQYDFANFKSRYIKIGVIKVNKCCKLTFFKYRYKINFFSLLRFSLTKNLKPWLLLLILLEKILFTAYQHLQRCELNYL